MTCLTLATHLWIFLSPRRALVLSFFSGLLLAILSSGLSLPAAACSGSKLDLDYCGAAPRPAPNPAPIYKPDFGGGSSGPTLPNPHPTVVTPTDSRGKTLYGPGIQEKF
jgi:hypothetical protein